MWLTGLTHVFTITLVDSYSCRGLSVCQNISRVIRDFLSFLGKMLKVLLIPDLAITVWGLIKLNQAVMSESNTFIESLDYQEDNYLV
jgi:hypothetical protein